MVDIKDSEQSCPPHPDQFPVCLSSCRASPRVVRGGLVRGGAEIGQVPRFPGPQGQVFPALKAVTVSLGFSPGKHLRTRIIGPLKHFGFGVSEILVLSAFAPSTLTDVAVAGEPDNKIHKVPGGLVAVLWQKCPLDLDNKMYSESVFWEEKFASKQEACP